MGIDIPELFVLLGILILIALPVVVVIFAVLKLSKRQQTNLKKCPFCAELIQPEAIVCRFCGHDLVK